MQMNVKDVLGMVDFLADNVIEVRYQLDPRSYWVNKAPAGGYCGPVLLRINPMGTPNLEMFFLNELRKLGIVGARLVGVDGGNNNAIKFKVGSRDGDIVAILDAAMEKKKLCRDAAELKQMNPVGVGLS